MGINWFAVTDNLQYIKLGITYNLLKYYENGLVMFKIFCFIGYFLLKYWYS